MFCRVFDFRRMFLIFIVLFITTDISFAKKKKKEYPEATVAPEVFTPDADDYVSLSLPNRKKISFFDSIDKNIISLVEDGSPESLKKAISLLKKNNDVYTDYERVLIYVVSSIFKVCYPSEVRSFPFININVDDLKNNPYIGAVDFALDGLFDFSIGDNDFIALISPCIVLASSSSRDDYYTEAENSLKKALGKKSDSVIANYLFALLYKKLNKFDEANIYFEKIQSVNCFEILYNNVDSLFNCKEYVKSIEILKVLLASPSFNTSISIGRNILKLCAESFFEIGDYVNAEEYVLKVLQQEPDNIQYVLFRAKILMAKGDFIRAATLLDVYARSDTTSKDYLILRARLQKDWNRNITAATSTIETAFTLYPEDIDVLFSAARIASSTGGKVCGMSSGDFATLILMMQPGNIEALKMQIDDFTKKNNWEEAYNLSTEVLSKEKANDNFNEDDVFSHINICLSSNRFEEAWDIVSGLYSQKSEDENVLQSYVKVLIAMNKKSEASSIISNLLPTASPKMKSFFYYQKSFIDISEDAILSDLRSSLTSNPRNKDSLFRLYSIYFGKKEYRKAQYYLKQVVALSPTDEKLLSLNASLDSLLKGGSK